MLHRMDPDGLIVITQPAHAWLSGQLARAWGNEQFGDVQPREGVCLGATLHDIGWTHWELEPELNRDTGLPFSFLQFPRRQHIAMWSQAALLALPESRYAALLVSMHGTRLYGRYDGAEDPPDVVASVHEYLDREKAFQQDLISTLRADPRYRPFATDDVITRNSDLVRTWDAMSLALCMGYETSVRDVPAARGTVTLTVLPLDEGKRTFAISPWPFAAGTARVMWEGRRLTGPFDDERSMRAALMSAAWVTVDVVLRP